MNIPVTVDIEAGYGENLSDIIDTVQKIIDMGGAGINIEDAIPSQAELEDISIQCKKISAIKSLSEACHYPIFINARTDVFWLKNLPLEQCHDASLQRLLAYQDSGASGLFIPGLNDLSVIHDLIRAVNLPVNILGGSWIKSITDLARIGVSRVSVGSTPCRVTAAFIQNMANMLIKQQDFTVFESAPSYDWLNKLF